MEGPSSDMFAYKFRNTICHDIKLYTLKSLVEDANGYVRNTSEEYDNNNRNRVNSISAVTGQSVLELYSSTGILWKSFCISAPSPPSQITSKANVNYAASSASYM